MCVLLLLQLHFVCDKSVMEDDPLVTSAIEAAKHKELAIKKTHLTKKEGHEKIASIVSLDQLV